MKSFRTNSIARSLIIAMTLLGWFMLSNHCALGRMARSSEAKKEHACCHNGDSKPEKEPTDGTQGVQCCKSLRAVAPDGVKIGVLTPPMFVIAVFASIFSLEGQADDTVVSPHNTGPPPRAESFSELVLHRSLRSHAPPFLA